MNIPNPNPPDDETGLVLQARADVNAFAEIYHRHVTRVYRYHMAHTGNIRDAEDLTSQTFMAALTGENLAALQAYQNQPVDVWGMIEMQDGRPVLQVERYEVPFPNLQFQILHGTQQSVTLEGQTATLFTATDGQTYVQMSPDSLWVDGSTVGSINDEVLLEALIIPGEAFGGYPALRLFSASPAVNTKTGQPLELSVTADQIYTVDEASEDEFIQPTAAIERIELVYYMPEPRYKTNELSPDEKYLQPAWLFSSHYNDGTEFFILVQALKRDFLLPETAPFTAPG